MKCDSYNLLLTRAAQSLLHFTTILGFFAGSYQVVAVFNWHNQVCWRLGLYVVNV